MAKLLIKFGVDIRLHSHATFRTPNGPLFHRWLPEGPRDSITTELPEQDAAIQFWFELCGYVSGYEIKFDSKRRGGEVVTSPAPLIAIRLGKFRFIPRLHPTYPY